MQELVIIPHPQGELTMLASELRALRKNMRKSPKPRNDGDVDYGLQIILFEPFPAPDGQSETAQLWFVDEAARDVVYDALRAAMEHASPTEEE